MHGNKTDTELYLTV